MDTNDLKHLKQEELFTLRRVLHKKQKNICPILKQEFDENIMVVDHQHKSAREEIGENGAGQIRGCIHRQANVWEGKIANSFVRLGLHKFNVTIPEALRNLADYLERKNLEFVHPNEVPKVVKKRLGKRLFAKISKAYSSKYPKRKPLEYPKTKKPILTKTWLELMHELNIKE